MKAIAKNRMKRIVTAVLALVLAVSIIAGCCVQALADDDLSQLQQEQQNLEDQQQQNQELQNATQQQLQDAQEKVDAVTSEVADINDQIQSVGEKITDLNNKIADNEKTLEDTKAQLKEQKAELATYYDKFKGRVQMMYENDRTSYLEVLLDASSISDFFSRLEYVSQVVDYDNNVMNNMKAVQAKIEQSKSQIEATQKDLETNKADLEDQQQQLQSALDEKQATLDSLNDDKVALELLAQQQQEQQDSIVAMLQANADAQTQEKQQLAAEQAAAEEAARLEAEKEAEAKAQQANTANAESSSSETGGNGGSNSNAGGSGEAGNTENSGSNNGESSNSENSGSNGGGSSSGGGSNTAGTADPADGRARSDGYWNTWPGIGSGVLGWPLDGGGWHYVLSSLYGMRFHPILQEWRSHNGIDILANYGDAIYAAQGGTVVTANTDGWGSGYGNYVVIDHGNGLSTLYGHMSSVAVSAGDTVYQGQVIGYVGTTGMSTGPHLHFEVYYYGVLQDPENYL